MGNVFSSLMVAIQPATLLGLRVSVTGDKEGSDTVSVSGVVGDQRLGESSSTNTRNGLTDENAIDNVEVIISSSQIHSSFFYFIYIVWNNHSN